MFPRNKYLLPVIALCFTIFMQGCAKDDGMGPENLDSDGFSGIAAFNAIEGTSNLQLLIDGKLINKDNENFSTGGYLNHRTLFPGKRLLELKTTKGAVLYATEKVFQSPKIYSYFFYGANNREPLVTEDDVIKPETGKMKVRLVNLVSDSRLKLDFQYLNSKVTHDMENRVFGLNEYSSKEDFKFEISSTDRKYDNIEINLAGKDRSVFSIVLYTEQEENSEKREIKYKILEL
ncbi:DUF4397 domain-containing protein [Sphingobacterium sp.]|uniref:DUF4397 domain-containing protein n=1 Tax=Sphingobacterium sp. TaxID=341027 RepID=UPI0028AAA63E|nr:DUF4397 domain-containing protein [Sphingobacterium sp.]